MSVSAQPRAAEGREASLRRLTAAEIAWAALLPCALATAAAVALLGPLLGHALLSPGAEAPWPSELPISVFGHAEPEKHGRFLVALLGPVLLVAAVLWGSRRTVRTSPAAARAVVVGSQALLAVALLAATLAQRSVVYAAIPAAWHVFSIRTLLAAPILAAACVLLPRVPRVARRLPALGADTPLLSRCCLAVAALCTALWLLPAIVTERSAFTSPFSDLVPWSVGDTYAVLDGRTPLVDFHPIYGHLWAYLAALAMALHGATLETFSVVMASGSAAGLMAVYALLRRVAGRPLLALALYLPFLATALFAIKVDSERWMVSNSEIPSVWPMRYAGPLLLAWLTARHLTGAPPRRRWALFAVAGLVALNNLEFGLGALAGTMLALLCEPGSRSRRQLRSLGRAAASGLLAAVLAEVAFTLVRTGSLPRFGLLLEFPRVFGIVGEAALPMAPLGFHLVMYATFGAALVVAAVRATRRDEDVPLTGMLVWSGAFGLGAGNYFAGRSDAFKLASLLPAWALSLMLLVVVVARALAARGWRRLGIDELLVVLGFALALCSLPQLPSPIRQLQRLEPRPAAEVYRQPDAHRLVADTASRGEHVAILIPLGHRIAYDLHLVDVAPYGFMDEIVTRRQMRVLMDAIRRGHAHKFYVLDGHLALAQHRVLARAGFSLRARRAGYLYWADRSVAR